MLSVRGPMSQATKAQLASQWSAGLQLVDQAVDSLEQLSELNLGMARVMFEQSNLVARQLAAAENTRQFVRLAAAQATPATGRVFDYGYYLASIASSAQEEFIKLVGMRIEDNSRAVIALFEEIGNAAPSGFMCAARLFEAATGNAASEARAPRIRRIGHVDRTDGTASGAMRRQHG